MATKIHNNIISIVFIACATLFNNNIHAQNPGFQGKRTLLEYKFNYMLAFDHPNAQNRSIGNGFGLNTSHRASLSYTFSRQYMAGVHFDYFITGIELPDDENELTFQQLKVNTIGVHLNRYILKKGALAPFGFYWKTGANFIMAETINIPKKTKVHTLSNSIGIGIRRVFFERLVLNFSGQLAWVWGYHFGDHQTYNASNRIRGRLLNHYIFENSVGVGFLF